MNGVWVLGAGGHAKVVIDTIKASGQEVLGVLDDDDSRWNEPLMGLRVHGPMQRETLAHLRITHAIIAIGSNRTRADLTASLAGAVSWATVVHPTAYVAPSATLGPGTVVLAGAIVQPDAQIGEHVIINTGAIVEHDVIVEDFAHVAPHVCLAGEVRIAEGAFLGVGSKVIPRRSVGAWATVGAGAVVIRDVANDTIVVGVPARVMDLRKE